MKSNFKISYPGSEKVYVQGTIHPEIKVGMRKVNQMPTVSIKNGERIEMPNPSIYIYDTSGPYSDDHATIDIEKGLPHLREPWIRQRAENDKENVCQMYYAKQGIITPEMEYVAIRENMNCKELGIKTHITPEFVCKEVAEGRAVIPANINHPESEPMIIGRNFLTKINTNIGNSATSSSIEEEVEKAIWSCKWELIPHDEDGLTVREIATGNTYEAVKAVTKQGSRKRWRIPWNNKTGWRYFEDKDIKAYQLRKQIESLPLEEQHKRNNVEAAMFQYSFHTRNGKTRYRGLLKHRMHAYSRCMWMNLRRMVIFQISTFQRSVFALFGPIREAFGSFMAISRKVFTCEADCYVSLSMTTLVMLDSKYAPFLKWAQLIIVAISDLLSKEKENKNSRSILFLILTDY